MNEKIIGARQNGMAVLILTIIAYLAATALVIVGAIMAEGSKLVPLAVTMIVVRVVWLVGGWIPVMGR